MSFNVNSVEHYNIQKLSGVNLNAADPLSSLVKEDVPPYGSFPWQYRSDEALNRPTDQVHSDRVLLEGELREALIRLNLEHEALRSFVLIANSALMAFKGLNPYARVRILYA